MKFNIKDVGGGVCRTGKITSCLLAKTNNITSSKEVFYLKISVKCHNQNINDFHLTNGNYFFVKQYIQSLNIHNKKQQKTKKETNISIFN